MAASSKNPPCCHEDLNSIFLNAETVLFLHQVNNNNFSKLWKSGQLWDFWISIFLWRVWFLIDLPKKSITCFGHSTNPISEITHTAFSFIAGCLHPDLPERPDCPDGLVADLGARYLSRYDLAPSGIPLLTASQVQGCLLDWITRISRGTKSCLVSVGWQQLFR